MCVCVWMGAHARTQKKHKMYGILLIYTIYIYEGELKSKGKIHLTALIEVTVSNFTYHFST